MPRHEEVLGGERICGSCAWRLATQKGGFLGLLMDEEVHYCTHPNQMTSVLVNGSESSLQEVTPNMTCNVTVAEFQPVKENTSRLGWSPRARV